MVEPWGALQFEVQFSRSVVLTLRPHESHARQALPVHHHLRVPQTRVHRSP